MKKPLILVLDDDPTGVQTVHDVWVYYGWSAAVMQTIFARDQLAFIQTNSRSLPEAEAIGITRQIMQLALAESHKTGREFRVISRSDSSLRGHFPAEPDTIRQVLEADAGQSIDGVILCFVLPEAGRQTQGNVHYIRQPDGTLRPVADTEFARDATFGYRSADLSAYVAEKTGGRIPSETVRSLPLTWLETGDVAACLPMLLTLENGQPLVVNGVTYDHLAIAAEAIRQAEARGKRFVFRTAAAFVKAYAQIPDRPLLTRADLTPYLTNGPVLTVVGSHTANTTRQLSELLAQPGIQAIELNVTRLHTDATSVVADAIRQMQDAVTAGRQPVLFTSRQVQGTDASATDALAFSRRVSNALMAVVQAFPVRPRAIVAKGGITSSDVATQVLGMKKALILGQIRPSIPVVLTDAESRFPQLPYIIFPGNTGQLSDLSSIWQELTR